MCCLDSEKKTKQTKKPLSLSFRLSFMYFTLHNVSIMLIILKNTHFSLLVTVHIMHLAVFSHALVIGCQWFKWSVNEKSRLNGPLNETSGLFIKRTCKVHHRKWAILFKKLFCLQHFNVYMMFWPLRKRGKSLPSLYCSCFLSISSHACIWVV